MPLPITIEKIRSLFSDAVMEGELLSDGIFSAASLKDAGPSDASFCQKKSAVGELAATKAGLVFVPVGVVAMPAPGQVFVQVADPSLGLAKLCEIIESELRPDPAQGVDPRAFVDLLAKVDPSVFVGPMTTIGAGSVLGAGTVVEANVAIGRNVKIGAKCHIYPGVVIGDYCVIGDNVRLQPGVKIGGDGFGYIQVGALPNVVHYKVPQIGNVVIADNVEIGANATIDRARFGSTEIGEGTKIDNHVQIAHNVKVGRRCIICAAAAIAGSTTIGDYVLLWGQCAITGHISIGSYSVVGGQAGVAKSFPERSNITGTLARPFMEERRAQATLNRLVKMMPELRKLLDEQNDANESADE